MEIPLFTCFLLLILLEKIYCIRQNNPSKNKNKKKQIGIKNTEPFFSATNFNETSIA